MKSVALSIERARGILGNDVLSIIIWHETLSINFNLNWLRRGDYGADNIVLSNKLLLVDLYICHSVIDFHFVWAEFHRCWSWVFIPCTVIDYCAVGNSCILVKLPSVKVISCTDIMWWSMKLSNARTSTSEIMEERMG